MESQAAGFPSLPPQLAAAMHSTAAVARLLELAVELQQIPAPTGREQARAEWVAAVWRRLGLAEVTQDEVQNVYARLQGSQPGAGLLVSAHTDTVFPVETDLRLRRDEIGGRLCGPGIGDNAVGVAGLLLLAELLRSQPLPVDIWLLANSNEEGLGDLKGMRAALDRLADQVGACLVVEGMGLGRIVHRALSSRRYRIDVRAPGGHSWGDFGAGSATHLLTALAADLTRMKLPRQPKTTLNIGRIWGGTSVNTIAQSAGLELDMRSEETLELTRLVGWVDQLIEEYQRRHAASLEIEVAVTRIGERPAGEISPDHFLVEASRRALAAAGYDGPVELQIGSTDANLPLSRQIPTVCVGLTTGGAPHRSDEWIATAPLAQGFAHLLALVWWAAAWLGEGAAAAGEGG